MTAANRAEPDVPALFRDGILRIADLPPRNPHHLDFDHYTIPLIAHDYAAKTPAMWNHAYGAFGLHEGNIVAIADPQSVQVILEAFRRDPRYVGGGAGVGCKERAFDVADELDPLAAAIGSVNFLLKTPTGKLRGYNTDGEGYAVSLEALLRERGETLRDRQILILGAGGTAAAIVFALAARGSRIAVVNRTLEKARSICQRVSRLFPDANLSFAAEDQIRTLARKADIIVNTSTKGATGPLDGFSALAPAELPATPESIARNLRTAGEILAALPPRTILSDVVLTPGGTPFLNAAQSAGFTVLDGVGMVVNQAVEAFWILHGSQLGARGLSRADVAASMNAALSRSERSFEVT